MRDIVHAVRGIVALVVLSLTVGCGDEAEPPPTVEPIVEPIAEPVEQDLAPVPAPVRAGPQCTYHGWCWQNPRPQGNALHGVTLAGESVVAVGERGTIVRRREGAWQIEHTPTREMLLDVWADDSGQTLLAAGREGTLVRYADGSWEPVEIETDHGLYSIDGLSADRIYVVGEVGTVLTYDGAAWSASSIDTPLTLVDVRATTTGAYALGVDLASDEPAATVFVLGEEGWTEHESFGADLGALWVSDSEVVVAGADARHQSTGGAFETESLDLARPVEALFGVGQVRFAVGYDGSIAEWSGSSWSEVDVDEAHDLYAIAGDESDVWVVGADGIILHHDGERWQRDGSGSTAHLKGIWGFAADDVWAVGDHQTLHYDGARWEVAGPDEHDLRGLWGSDGVLLAAGDDGALWRFAEGSWTAEHSAGGEELNGVWGADVAHAFVVGKDVWLEHEDGEWIEHTDRPDAAHAWGASRDDVWVAGREGLHHWDGSAWTQAEGTADQVLFGVFGVASEDVWAVGAGGRVLHYQGESWTEVEAPTRQSLLGIWGPASDDMWAVGEHGTIIHWDGETWSWRDSGTDELLHSVWGPSADEIFVVGHGGTVLSWSGTQ